MSYILDRKEYIKLRVIQHLQVWVESVQQQLLFSSITCQPIITGNIKSRTITNHRSSCTNFIGYQYNRLVTVDNGTIPRYSFCINKMQFGSKSANISYHLHNGSYNYHKTPKFINKMQHISHNYLHKYIIQIQHSNVDVFIFFVLGQPFFLGNFLET